MLFILISFPFLVEVYTKMPAVATLVLGFVSLSFFPRLYGYSFSSRGTGQAIEGRRAFITGATTFLPLAIFTSTPSGVNAFENRLDNKYSDVTPQVGTKPSDLGHTERLSKSKASYIGLKQCGNSPNCWCSSTPFADSPARFIPAWTGHSIKDLKYVIDTYQVGQNGIDGGGFNIIEYDEKEKYIYVQFQSYKAGYIDDFECWFNPQSQKFDIRSSSRVGVSDLGVNAKRLEYFAGRLDKEFGWKFERRKNGSLV